MSYDPNDPWDGEGNRPAEMLGCAMGVALLFFALVVALLIWKYA